MALRGRKPTATVVKLVTGKPGRLGTNTGEPRPNGKPKPPVPMQGRPAALWRQFITKAWWLSATDGPKAWLWCHLQAEAEDDPKAMTAARIGQLRYLGSELGFDPASRARLGAGSKPAAADPAEKYFD